MNIGYIKKMFVGEILIVDDEINEEGTDAYMISEYLQNQGFSVIRQTTFPSEQILAGHKISMVICDWLFNKINKERNAEAVISFINEVQSKEFVPVFICSSLEKEDIKNYLKNPKFKCTRYKDNDASSIFIVKKDEIQNEKIFEFLEGWLMDNPSVKLLKEWELSLNDAKNRMFNDLYMASEYWPYVLYNTFEKDEEKDIGEAMGDFVTKNLLSRITEYNIKVDSKSDLKEINLVNVLEGERCYYYKDKTVSSETSFKTGDILKKEEDLYIVIKRQCDLNRKNNNDLYILKMNEVKNLSSAPIRYDKNENVIKIFDTSYSLSTSQRKINEKLDSAFDKTCVLHRGKILERVFEVIIPCVYDMDAVSIDLRSLEIIQIENKVLSEYERVVRLLEPYISIVTDKFASYISSKGSMRVPRELFEKKYFIDDCEE